MFEKEFGLFTANGTTAIWLALTALGIKKKRIIIPANICFVVVCAIILSDNEPCFVDIDDNFSIDPKQLKDIGSKEVAGIVFPHMYGNVGSIEEVLEIAKSKKWIVIEDVAQALGAKKGKKYAGSFADFSITSFGMGKIIDVNTGGMLTFNSKKIYKSSYGIYKKLPVLNRDRYAAYLRFNEIYNLLIDCIEKKDQLYRFGMPLSLSYKDANINQIGLDLNFLVQLEKEIADLDEELAIRSENAESFQSILNHKNIRILKHREGSTYWRQNILVKEKRGELLKYLKENKVKASKYFPSIDRLFYPRLNKNFIRSDTMAAQIINLWPSRQTKKDDIIRINKLINNFYKNS
ncbi:MAG: DegT/DnrJ/EryC1/StrS family aminotransferase [Candidatus Omnitrophica bacterium]|nr:DegT/DnrJ/EryC1/StrS family aminotransferase [Candidatus Omnitrophota bacterium]